MELHCYASRPHYAAHAVPVWAAARSPGRLVAGSQAALRWMLRRGYQPDVGGPRWRRRLRSDDTGTWLVASYSDLEATAPHPAVYLEHGAGQTYAGQPGHPAGTHPHYAGGASIHYDRVRLFLAPSSTVAAAQEAAHPGTPAVAVGCPRLDAVARARRAHRSNAEQQAGLPCVAVSFHHPARGVRQPEAGTAFPAYRASVAGLASDTWGRWRWVGHGHPLAEETYRAFWEALPVRWEPDVDAALAQADVWVVDNSSTLYEAAALGIPTVALTDPAWRRDVHHGLRFWDTIPGVHCEHPDALEESIVEALADRPPLPARRARAAREVYAVPPGEAVNAAVDALRAALV